MKGKHHHFFLEHTFGNRKVTETRLRDVTSSKQGLQSKFVTYNKSADIGNGFLNHRGVARVRTIGPHAADTVSSFEANNVKPFFAEHLDGSQTGRACDR